MIAGCILFDSKYSIEGWLCVKSIHNHTPNMRVYVLCMDERVFCEAVNRNISSIIPIRLYEFEQHYPELLQTRLDRPWPPYTQTCKVFLPSYIFEVFGEKSLFYVDSDMFFWSSAHQIEGVLGNCSFMVTSREHDPPPVMGRFNGGFFACSNNNDAKTFLKWWQEQTVEWNLWQPGPDGRFGEEGYLNIFHDDPDRFHGIRVSPHPGINLAKWNIDKHRLERIEDDVVIDSFYPLICFHYQGIRIQDNKINPDANLRGRTAKYIFETYRNKYLTFKEEFLHGLDSERWW